LIGAYAALAAASDDECRRERTAFEKRRLDERICPCAARSKKTPRGRRREQRAKERSYGDSIRRSRRCSER
jgi:hypothetical protein